MALETATYISDLVISNPPAGDPKSQGDDHLRLIKTTIKNTLPNLTGAMNATQTELNRFVGSLGVVVDRAYGEYLTNADITATIPLDDTIPQNTEGTQILSVSLTPKSATNRVRVRFQGSFAISTAANAVAAVFSSASANALVATTQSETSANLNFSLVIEHEYVPGVTTALTFTVRVGTTSGTMRMNGSPGFGRVFGGVSKSTLIVEEIAV